MRSLFLERLEPEYRPFMTAFVTTQAFQNFIDARIQPDPEDLDVKLFDESIEAKRNRSRLHVIKKDTEVSSVVLWCIVLASVQCV
jgi:dDENN domain